MDFQDKTLACRDCGKDFVWTASEQEFYQKKGFTNAPVRCAACRALKKSRMNDTRGGGSNFARQSFEITCAQCGKTDTVPFKPKGDRPVLCRDCFRTQRA
jgi:CxxC-x17-CxxC domain-containing protein